MEEWQYLREAVASYAKISEYMDIFEVFKAYEITVKANEEYREHLNWLCDENTGNSLLNSAINEAVITLDKEYGVLFTFYMNLAKTVFSKVPSGAIKAIANNSMNQSLIDTLSKITGITDFIGSLGSYLAIAKVVFNTLFPVAEGYESMSKINVTEGIQDYSWELANELCKQDLTFDNLAHIRQSYIMALKSSRLCFKAQQETFDPFSDDNILSYKFDAIDEKTAEFVCSADSGLNDSIDGKKDFTKNLLDLFKSVKFYNEDSIFTIDSVRQAFVNAGKVYSKWRYPDVSETDIIESADAGYGAYYAVRENVSTINDLRLEVKEFFTDEACDELIGDHYIERNGKLYFDRWPFGIEDTLYVLSDELTNTDEGLIYKVYFRMVDHMGNSVEDVFEMKIISDNHKYIFEDYGVFFARLSGEINRLYFSEESYPSNQEIDNISIKTAYKSLVDSLYTDGDLHCEYMIYDMDKDGTTELIYMKGTCMADLKNYYYTYKNGEIIELGKTFSHTIFRTEDSIGVYAYWARMQGDILLIVKKVGDTITISFQMIN